MDQRMGTLARHAGATSSGSTAGAAAGSAPALAPVGVLQPPRGVGSSAVGGAVITCGGFGATVTGSCVAAGITVTGGLGADADMGLGGSGGGGVVTLGGGAGGGGGTPFEVPAAGALVPLAAGLIHAIRHGERADPLVRERLLRLISEMGGDSNVLDLRFC